MLRQSGRLQQLETSMRQRKVTTTQALGDTWIINAKDIEYLKTLGQGAFGTVYKALIRGKTVAVKTLNRINEEQVEEFQVEFEVMASIGQEPNVVQVLGVSIEPKLTLVMELCERGSLQDVLKNPQIKLGRT